MTPVELWRIAWPELKGVESVFMKLCGIGDKAIRIYKLEDLGGVRDLWNHVTYECQEALAE